MTTTDYDPRAAAERGAILLDAEDPGWFVRVDLKTLAMVSQCRCVLGQMYGRYKTGIARLDLLVSEHEDVYYGFDAPGPDTRFADQFAALEAAWTDEVAKRTLVHAIL